VARLTIALSFLAGGCAGIAGAIEVGAVHHTANATLIAGYGYTGVLVAFLARQHPLAAIPVSLLLGGINASGGLLQRTAHFPMRRSRCSRESCSSSFSRARPSTVAGTGALLELRRAASETRKKEPPVDAEALGTSDGEPVQVKGVA